MAYDDNVVTMTTTLTMTTMTITTTVTTGVPQGGGGSEAPLGRVFVEDPDDWDLGDKTFRWLGTPHPFFTLNTHTGDLLASSQVREGR